MRLLHPIAAIGWTLSVGLHLAAVLLLPRVSDEPRSTSSRRSLVSFSVAASVKAATPRPAPPLQSREVPAARSASRSVAPTTSWRTRSTPDPAPKSVDLTGVTLTGSDGAEWSSVTGNGQPMDAPIVPTVATTVQTTKQRGPTKSANNVPARPEPELVALRDLSEKPVPPPLDAELLRNYPLGAKRQGMAGKAVVVARIDADGVVRDANVFSQSGAEFGAACQRTLLGSRWSAPRDRGGKSVNTRIYYTCEFRVDG
jgi:TonB family protein